MTTPISLDGIGLHSGAPCRVTLCLEPGPVALRARGILAPLADLVVASTARATTVESRSGLRVGTVEHALSALAGLGVYDGLVLDVDGPELPLLDGGCSVWCAAIRRLDLRASSPHLRVARSAVLQVGPSRFDFTPDDGIDVSVRLELDDAPHVLPDARWRGAADDFVARIAPARTFVLARELEELVRRGLARHADPECVVVVTSDGLLHAGRPAAADEPARHKLLDLVGDLYLYGGPPIGRVHAHRPGHAANARAVRRALDEGVLVRA